MTEVIVVLEQLRLGWMRWLRGIFGDFCKFYQLRPYLCLVLAHITYICCSSNFIRWETVITVVCCGGWDTFSKLGRMISISLEAKDRTLGIWISSRAYIILHESVEDLHIPSILFKGGWRGSNSVIDEKIRYEECLLLLSAAVILLVVFSLATDSLSLNVGYFSDSSRRCTWESEMLGWNFIVRQLDFKKGTWTLWVPVEVATLELLLALKLLRSMF